MPGLISTIFAADDADAPETTMDLGVAVEGDLLSPTVTLESGGTHETAGGESHAWDNTTAVALNADDALDA